MATVRHVTSGSRLKIFQAAWFLLNRWYGVLIQVSWRVFSRVWSFAPSFNLKFSLVSSRSSNSYLRLLPCLPSVLILYSTFPSITSFIRQFVHKIWPIHLAFRHFILRKIFFSFLTLCHNSSFPTRSVHWFSETFLTTHFKTLRYFWSTFRSVHFSSPHKPCFKHVTLLVSSLHFIPICWRKVFCFCHSILIFIARLYLAPFVIV